MPNWNWPYANPTQSLMPKFKRGTLPTHSTSTGSRWIRAKLTADVFPSTPACYVVFEGKKLLYVGSAINLRGRLNCHRIYEGMIGYRQGVCNPAKVTIAYRPTVKYGDWAMVEIRLIRRLKPPINGKRRLE